AIHGRTGGLDHKDVLSAHVFAKLNVDLAVRKLLHHGLTLLEFQGVANLLRQGWIRVAREHLEAVVVVFHPEYRLLSGHSPGVVCSFSARLHSARYRARPTSEIGNVSTSPNNSMARETPSPSGNNPNRALPLPVIRATVAPARTNRFLRVANFRCWSKTTLSKSLRAEARLAVSHVTDWKLTILFCCNSVVKRGLRSR